MARWLKAIDDVLKVKVHHLQTGRIKNSEFIDWVDKQPTVEPKQEWISTADRLPEDDLPEGSKTKRIKVLVAIKKDNGRWVIRSQTRVKDGFRYWQESGWDWGKHSYGEFTHWMPLPEPPENE